ncbi:heme-dependent catalase [Lophiostoma macrostomum CBS 122681]|uniref:Heme-dependent catalase n=1 Tax=Lophiostoma macrostomum CBS 122681 TaxID=1314788 RepID=A0A6A6T5K6_9PLEO|nr:heme-dependent catalase [Lophiostoma macrostomum CBS 122681]
MPLSDDAKILETSERLVDALRGAAADVSKEFRPAHARGHILTGTFTPSQTASTLTTAPHFNNPSTSLTIRFSSSTGIPEIPDTDPTANPRGIGIRFHLPNSATGHRQHTDIIAHSTPSFPTRTGAEFLELLSAVGNAGADGGASVKAFIDAHPETGRFLGAAKPSPKSFSTELYYGVNAYKFIGKEGKETFVRYRVVPVAGLQTYSAEEVKEKGENYLFDGLKGDLPFEFKLVVQVAQDGDVTDNATVVWPEEREVVELGTIKVEGYVNDAKSKEEQKSIIFDPIPRVKGVEVSADPLLEVRANVYLISGKQRREA